MTWPAPSPRDGPGTWSSRLSAGGLSSSAAERVARSLDKASACLHARTGLAPEFAFFVPGRIEVLGKHTDYAGGRSLLAAMEWGFVFVGSREAAGNGLLVLDVERERGLHLPLRTPPAASPRGWALYPATVIRRVAQDFPGMKGGVSMAFASDLPPASGMSSSSALVVGTFLALAAGLETEASLDAEDPGSPSRAFGSGLAAGLPADFSARERLAAYLAAVESGRPFPGLGSERPRSTGTVERLTGVGTDGGSEDHAAILAARPGQVVRYGFLPTLFEAAAPLPPGWTFIVASSGVRAEKARGAKDVYNRLAGETYAAARIWREETGGTEPHLGAILAFAPDARSRMEHLLRAGGHDRLLDRFRQFATESTELVPGAAAALHAGELDALGDIVARSQALADEVLANQVPETRHLVASARELGAVAASAFGAGFGGAVWALVPSGDVAHVLAEWRADYVRRFPDREATCAFVATEAGPAAFRLV